MIEIDEDGHPYYKHDENLGFTFIRINPDPNAGFDPDVEIAKIYNYINESPVKLAVNLAEKSFKEKFAKELLSDMSCFSGPLNTSNISLKKYCLQCKDMKNTQSKIKPIKTRREIGTMYCLGCKDYFKSQGKKMTNKVL